MHFCVWLGIVVDRWWLKEVWYAPDFLSNCSTCVPVAAPGITGSPSKRISRGTLSQKTQNWSIWQAAHGYIASVEPSLRTPLLWKVGLHVQSEDQRVFVCAKPSLFSQHLFVVFLGSEIVEIRRRICRQPGVLNDRRCKPSSLRREANDGRQRELARGLENNLAHVAKSQCLNAWYQSLTSSLFFLAKELEWTSSLSRLGTVAPDRRLSSRKQHGRLGMCLFVSGGECYHVYHECEHQDVLPPKQDSNWGKLSTE